MAVTEPNDTGSRRCTKCGATKPLSQFGPQKSGPDGISRTCVPCAQAYRAQYYQKNKTKLDAQARAWKGANPGRVRQIKADWLDKNREYHAAYCKAQYWATKPLHQARSRTWYENNKQVVKDRVAHWQALNPERAKFFRDRYAQMYPERKKAATKAWFEKNPHMKRHYSAQRRAAELRATPPWLTDAQKAEITEIYEVAYWLTENDTPCHVDHIEPLRGRDRCGLHVPWNLQILTATENRKKSNKVLTAGSKRC